MLRQQSQQLNAGIACAAYNSNLYHTCSSLFLNANDYRKLPPVFQVCLAKRTDSISSAIIYLRFFHSPEPHLYQGLSMQLLWFKAFHLIAVICWFAALFYLPRLFVYHAMSDDIASTERFKIMERKLYRGIMTPAAIATVLLGAWMVYLNLDYYKTAQWLKWKLLLVVLLVTYHATCGHFVRVFANDANTRSHVFFRVFNELPVLLLVGIVLLAVLKPF